MRTQVLSETKAELLFICKQLGIKVPAKATKKMISDLICDAQDNGAYFDSDYRSVKAEVVSPQKTAKPKKSKPNDLQKAARKVIRDTINNHNENKAMGIEIGFSWNGLGFQISF